jgi:hypothetical protein
MSDIGLDFPLWVNVAFLGAIYWWIFAPAALAFVALAGFGRGLPTAARYAAGIAAGVCAAPFVLLLVVIVGGEIGDARRAAEEQARRRTLTADEVVESLPLPAGAALEFTDASHRALTAVMLPRPALVAGIALQGELEPIRGREWAGELAHDQTISGWPCKAGVIWFTTDGAPTRCVLAAAHRLAGYDLPTGAECAQDPFTGVWDFQLTLDGPALRIAALDADLPPGGTLTLAADGTLRRLYVPHETRMTIAGVALYDHVVVEGATLTAELAEPRLVAGATLPADAVVRLNPTTGALEPTTRSPVVDP